MDLKEENIYKLFALGWNGKENFFYIIIFSYETNIMVRISYSADNNIVLYHYPSTAIDRIVSAAFDYFKTKKIEKY